MLVCKVIIDRYRMTYMPIVQACPTRPLLAIYSFGESVLKVSSILQAHHFLTLYPLRPYCFP